MYTVKYTNGCGEMPEEEMAVGNCRGGGHVRGEKTKGKCPRGNSLEYPIIIHLEINYIM